MPSPALSERRAVRPLHWAADASGPAEPEVHAEVTISPEHRALGHTLCQQLGEEIRKLGFPLDRMPPMPEFDQASFSRAKDPFSGLDSLVGIWTNARGHRIGEIKIHGNGSFYAEYDVTRPHPSNRRWFVESVVAWGRGRIIKTEAKLLPALEP